MLALVITGPPGAGKSEVAAALHDALGASGQDAALIEADELERSHPPIGRERSLDHLRMLAGSYRELGTPLVIVTATLEDRAHREALDAALGAERVLLARLEAKPETLRERILAREAPGWDGLAELLNASRALAASMPEALGAVDLVLSTEGEVPSAVASRLKEELRAATGGR